MPHTVYMMLNAYRRLCTLADPKRKSITTACCSVLQQTHPTFHSEMAGCLFAEALS